MFEVKTVEGRGNTSSTSTDIRSLGYLVCLLGFVYFGVALFAYYSFISVNQLLDQYGFPKRALKGSELGLVLDQIVAGSATFVALGFMLGSIGIGLIIGKKWAWNLWLPMVVLLVIFHLLRFLSSFQLGAGIVFFYVAEFVLIVLMTWRTWKILRPVNRSIADSLDSD